MDNTCECPGGYWSGPKLACSGCGEPTARRCVGCEVYLCIDCGSRRHPRGGRAVTELRVQIHDHLQCYPWLTAYEVARALGRPGNSSGIKRELARMAGDGEAESRTRPRDDVDKRPIIQWRAT